MIQLVMVGQSVKLEAIELRLCYVCIISAQNENDLLLFTIFEVLT